MTEEEKKAIKYFKALDKLTFEPYLSILLNLLEKQQKEIEELNEKISKAIGHIEVCKTTLGNYILTPDQIECLLNILSEE